MPLNFCNDDCKKKLGTETSIYIDYIYYTKNVTQVKNGILSCSTEIFLPSTCMLLYIPA